jgi:hypothetical protein
MRSSDETLKLTLEGDRARFIDEGWLQHPYYRRGEVLDAGWRREYNKGDGNVEMILHATPTVLFVQNDTVKLLANVIYFSHREG